jgi:hypothetical protein
MIKKGREEEEKKKYTRKETRLRSGRPRNHGSISDNGKTFLCFVKFPDQLLVTPRFLSNGYQAYQGLYPSRRSSWRVTVTIHLHLFCASNISEHVHHQQEVTVFWGRATAQAVGRLLPTAAVRVRSKVMLCGIYGGQIGTRVDILRVLQLPLPILITLNAPQSSLSIIPGLVQ